MNTKRATGRIEHGLVCNVRQDDYTATMDMPEPIGGEGSAPSPGFHIRVGLVGCVAIGIKLTAAREGVDIGAIDVDVEMDFDDAAMIGVSDNSAAPLETRIIIAIQSTAPWEEVTAMVGRALERDPYFIAFRDAQPMKTKLVQAGASHGTEASDPRAALRLGRRVGTLRGRMARSARAGAEHAPAGCGHQAGRAGHRGRLRQRAGDARDRRGGRPSGEVLATDLSQNMVDLTARSLRRCRLWLGDDRARRAPTISARRAASTQPSVRWA